MERLTFEGNFCEIARCKEVKCPYDTDCSQKQVWERLKAYEDTGLEPEAVETVKLALCAKHMVDLETLNNTPISRLVELAEADKDGRCVVLLCKVGDTVWLTRTWVSERLSQPEAAALTGAYICGNDVCTFVTNKYGFQQDKIGKNVFLTREEAEKALAEMEGKA